MEHSDTGRRMGHEFIGVVEAVGTDVQTVKAGDLVVSPFLWSDGTCVFCREGLQSECLHGGRYGFDDVDGGQGEAVRVPQADGTLVVLSVGADDALMPSLPTLSDVWEQATTPPSPPTSAPERQRRSSETAPSACAA
jgi:threonine dehydrogenase-like Zn-dependent dehydrogenase